MVNLRKYRQERSVWPALTAFRYAKIRAELWRRIEQDGVWFHTAEVKCGHCDEWHVVNSIGGFIGDDFEGSGYDTDLMSAAINAVNKQT